MFLRMSAKRRFPVVLRLAVERLNMTQQEFADAVDISVALLTKIFRGDEVHLNSLKKLVVYFRKTNAIKSGEKIAERLIIAYYQDALEAFGIPGEDDDGIAVQFQRLTRRQSQILSLFESMPGHLLFKLYFLGIGAKKDATFSDTLSLLADMAIERCEIKSMPGRFFREGIQGAVRTQPFRLLGGSMGEIISNLTDDE